MNQVALELEEETLSTQDYIAVFKRRRVPILLTVAIISALVITAAIGLPAKYTSQATILIEEQEIPREFVVSTITSFAAQQIQVISQRVLTAQNIATIADKFGLYVNPETNRRPPATAIAQVFRDQMELELVSADVIDPRSGRPQEATIAFTMAYEANDADTAQKVTSELVSLFLAENLRNRTEAAASTKSFLQAQADGLEKELVAMEEEIARIKATDGNALPEMFQYNLSTLDRTTGELGDIDRRIRQLERERVTVAAELGLTNPSSTRQDSTGGQLLSLIEQLRALNAEYQQKSTLYHTQHPDMLSLQRRIAELDDILARQQGQSQISSGSASNPSFILLRTRLEGLEGDIRALNEKRAELAEKVEYFESLISRAPSVETVYSSKVRDYHLTQQKYQDVRAKQREATATESLEEARKGERFVTIEPPNLPLGPSSPNRPAIILIGLLLAMGTGVAVAWLLESLDGAVHNEKMLTRLTGTPPFAVVGYIQTKDEVNKKRQFRRRILYAVIGIAVAAVIFVHLTVRPLDVLWFSIMNRIGL